MSAVLAECIEECCRCTDQRFVPASRIWRLADLLRIKAYDFISIGSSIQCLQTRAQLEGNQQAHAEATVIDAFTTLLEFVQSNCTAMGLLHTADICAAIQREQETCKNARNNDIIQWLKEINRSFVQETNREVFFHISQEKAKYLCRQNAFGEAVTKQFPSCANEIWTAGNCFALEVYDSCVFHLMRVLERGLAAMATKFGVTFDHRNWHNIIEEIESRVRKIDSSWGTDWKLEQKRYSEAACQFMFFKDAWRNHVMHVRDHYDDKRAKVIFDSVGHFMSLLAALGLTA